MRFYLMDTDTRSLLERRHPAVVRRYNTAPPPRVAITIITVEEQLAGWYKRLHRAKQPDQIARAYRQLTRVVTFLANMPVVTFTEPAIHRYSALRALKLNVGKMDLKIAAVALELGAIVVTRNLRDFGRVPNLVVEDWSV